MNPIWPSELHLILEHLRTITTYRAKQTGQWEQCKFVNEGKVYLKRDSNTLH